MAPSVAAFRATVDLSIEIAECGHCASYCDECCTQHKQLCFQDRSFTTPTPVGLAGYAVMRLPIALYGMAKTASLVKPHRFRKSAVPPMECRRRASHHVSVINDIIVLIDRTQSRWLPSSKGVHSTTKTI